MKLEAGEPTSSTELVAGARPWPRSVVALHWIGAALVISMLLLGTIMTRADVDAGQKFDLYQLHKSVGFALLAVTALRIAIRSRTRRPAWPSNMSNWEIRIARAAHVLLYALLLTLPLIGWVTVSAAPIPVPTHAFGLVEIPHLTGANRELYELARTAHRVAAWLLAGLVVLHVLAALEHHFWSRDETLLRMLAQRRD